MNIELKQWKERIDNLLDLQQCLHLEIITAAFSKEDLIELSLIINSLEDYICREQEKGGNNGAE